MTALSIVSIVCGIFLVILFLRKFFYKIDAENAKQYCEYKIWKGGEKNFVNKKYFVDKIKLIYKEMREYQDKHKGRIKRIFSIYNVWKEESKKISNEGFFSKLINFVKKEYSDSYIAQHKIINEFSSLWRKLPRKEKTIFFKQKK